VRVDVEAGTVVWPNGLDPDPYVLHGDYPPAAPSALSVRPLDGHAEQGEGPPRQRPRTARQRRAVL
jgi:hypothetical protein